jgi:hypothetical protein
MNLDPSAARRIDRTLPWVIARGRFVSLDSGGVSMSENGFALPLVYRLHIKPACPDRRLIFDFCLDRGVLGMGWGVSGEPATFSDYEHAAHWRVNPSVRALFRLPEGALIWTYDRVPRDFYLAPVTGPWQHLSDPEAVYVDIRNVRPVRLLHVATSQVPDAVRHAFKRGRTLQRVWNPDATWTSSQLAAALS